MEKFSKLASLFRETSAAAAAAAAATVRSSRAPATRMRSREDNLYRRLSALGGRDDASMVDALNQWLSEGKTLSKFDIVAFVTQLRRYKRFSHALKLLEWMENRSNNLTYSDHAMRIDLLSKARGITSAEKYFSSLSEPVKNKFTYGALLNCYCKEKMLDKAISLFEKMVALNFASTALAYNNLMSLYLKLEKPEKVPALVHEMKAKNISPDAITYNLLMHSYAALKDIGGVERVMEEVKSGSSYSRHWTQYSNVASIYITAGLFQKAEMALKELEKINKFLDRNIFHYLISLYASTKNAAEVNRVWKCLKLACPKTTNMSYLTMLHALAKLDDIEGMEKCFKDWELGCSSYDIRVSNVLMNAYIERGRVKEAESLLETAVRRGSVPNSRTLEMFLAFYLRNHEMKIGSELYGESC